MDPSLTQEEAFGWGLACFGKGTCRRADLAQFAAEEGKVSGQETLGEDLGDDLGEGDGAEELHSCTAALAWVALVGRGHSEDSYVG